MSTAISIPYAPRAWQQAVHQAMQGHRFTVVVAHRRSGKTVLSVATLISAAIATRNGRFAYVAPSIKQARGITWNLFKELTQAIPSMTFRESENRMIFPNGAEIALFSGEQHDAMRGIGLDGVVLDELAQFPPDAFGSSIRPTLSDRSGWALIIGTPAGLDLLHEFYQRGQDPSYPDWWSGLFPASQTGVLSREELDGAKRDTTSPDQYRREFEVDFTASADDVLIPLPLVQEAMQRRLSALSERALMNSAKIVGVDVARYGADSTVFFPRWGRQALGPIVIENSDLMYVVGKLSRFVNEWQPHAIFVDVGGIGAGVVDRMRQLGYDIFDVNFGARATDERFANMRAQMWFGMREWLQNDGILPREQRLLAEITSPNYTFDASNRIKLERKEEMKARLGRSPDLADALALTFAAPVAPPELPWEYRDLSVNPARAIGFDYDPYERI